MEINDSTHFSVTFLFKGDILLQLLSVKIKKLCFSNLLDSLKLYNNNKKNEKYLSRKVVK